MMQVRTARPEIDSPRVITQLAHLDAIERVVQTMREQLHEPLSLEDMADIAYLSPYYFCRVFHQIIGAPPGEYLATLRLDAAKRLLLTTQLSVTDICFEVGYVGLGSFTTRFTQLVGLSPRLLRHLARNVGLPSLPPPSEAEAFPFHPIADGSIVGRVRSEQDFKGHIFVGLFPRAIPQGKPVRCTMLTGPGPFALENVPDGRYFVMVAAMPPSNDPLRYLLPHDRQRVGMQGPIVVVNGTTEEAIEINLRPISPIDPPIVMALPYQRSAPVARLDA